MYSTGYRIDHVWFSQARFWMALYIGAMMAAIMLGFMLTMYCDKRKNTAIFSGSAVLFASTLFLASTRRPSTTSPG